MSHKHQQKCTLGSIPTSASNCDCSTMVVLGSSKPKMRVRFSLVALIKWVLIMNNLLKEGEELCSHRLIG